MSRQIYITIPITVFVLLFALSAGLSTTFTYDPALIGDSLLAILFSVVLYLVVAYTFASTPLARALSGMLLLVGVLFALLFIFQFRYQNYPETPNVILKLGNSTTLLPNLNLGYLHPNAAATFLEAIIPIGVVFVIARRSLLSGLVSLLLTAIMLYAVFLTFSRGAYIGLAATIPIFFIAWFLKRLSRPLATGILVVIIVGALVGVYILLTANPATSSPLVASGIEVGGSRLTLYRNSLFLIRDYVFTGIGLGDTFAMIYSRYSLLIQVPFLTYAHSLPLAVWLNQGLIGLISLAGIVVSFYLFVAYVLRRVVPSRLFHGAWLGVTATLVHGLTDARQYTESPWVMPLLFVMIGLTIAFGRIALKEERVYIPHYLGRYILRTVAVIFVIGVVAFLRRDTLVAAWDTNQGALVEARGELAPDLNVGQRNALYNEAQSWYMEALDSDPNYAPANRRLGNLFVERGNYPVAVPLLETAFLSESSNPATVKGLGLAYVWVGRTEDAAQVLAKLPPDADIENELYTWGYYRHDDQNRPLLAAYAWETGQLLAAEPNADVWAGIGDFYREAQEFTRAEAAYQRALEIEPDNQQAKDGLAALGG